MLLPFLESHKFLFIRDSDAHQHKVAFATNVYLLKQRLTNNEIELVVYATDFII